MLNCYTELLFLARHGALYKAFAPEEARRILRRLEFHYTPVHANWLNMVEIITWSEFASNIPYLPDQTGYVAPTDPRDACYFCHDVCSCITRRQIPLMTFDNCAEAIATPN